MKYNTDDILLAKRGDGPAFERVYKSIYPDLYRFAYYNVSNAKDAEDAVSECVLEAWKGLSSLKNIDAFNCWIMTILLRKCNALLKQRYVQCGLCQYDEDISDLEFYDRTSENTIENIALRSDIEQALSKLNNIDRQIVLLSIIGGYKSHEIGNMLYLNATTVRSKLNRSLAKVRQYLGGV